MKRIIYIILFAASFMAAAPSQSQILIGTRQKNMAKGFDYKELAADSVLRPPNLDTFHLKVSDSGAISYKNGCYYGWTGYKYGLITCIGSSAPTLSIVTHPASQTIIEGDPVTFTVAATGGITPYTYQWQKATVDISGATSSTYTIATTVSGDAGNYAAVVTDAASHTVTSNTAVLTITTPIVITYGYSSSDPYVDNSTAPTVSNSATTSIIHNADLSIAFPAAAVDKFLVFKVPSGESTKIHWFVTSLNNGDIPDAAFRAPFTVGSFTYYVTRDAAGFTFDYTQPVQLKQ